MNKGLEIHSAATLGRMIKNRKIAPLELVTAVLEKIARFDGRVNAFRTVVAETAMEDARKAQREIEKGEYRGPLHGVPFAVKDIFCTKGIPTTAGSKILEHYVPDKDALVVERLKKAGAVLVGKLNMHEFAFGITSRNPHYGPTLNPRDPSLMTGGSSSGSAAAVAAGFVPLTLGTDTGGSIRIPSSLCGVVGLKPTYGRISREGVIPLSWSMDHVGPMAGNVEDVALAFEILTGNEPAALSDEGSQKTHGGPDGLDGMVIGVPKGFFFENLREDIRASVLEAVERMKGLNVRVQEIEIPEIAEADRAAYTVLFSEAAACLEVYARTRARDVGEEVLANVRLGMTFPATRFIQAMRVRARQRRHLEDVFSKIDILVVPNTAVDAPAIDSEEVEIEPGAVVDVRTALTRFTRYFNLMGYPVLSLPCGVSSRGLPVGLQMAGPPFSERMLFRAGRTFEQACFWQDN